MLHRLIKFASPDVLLVKGPSYVMCEGKVFVLGMDACQNGIVVRAGKVLPFEALEDSRVRLRMAKGGSYRLVKNRKVGVSIWRDVAFIVTKHRPHRIMLVGANDTGKSTLAIYLSNVAFASGLKVSIVDGDVGQGDLAPPGCIGAARIIEQLLDLRDVKAEHYSFIGATSPRSVEALVIDSIKDIVTKLSSESDVCIVNTDGYIDEHGIDYKIELAETIKPDLIVYLGNPAKAGRLFDKFKDRIMRVDAPQHISKTRYEREKRRLDQYNRFVEGKDKIMFRIGTKKFRLLGRSCDMISTNGWIRLGPTLFPARFLYSMFVGLSSVGIVKGFGIILNLAHGMMTVRAQYEGDFDTVLLSSIRLSRKIKHDYLIPLAVHAKRRPE